MAQLIPVSLDLPADLLRALGHAAGRAGCSPADYASRALAAALGVITPGPGVAVRQALALAGDWCDLQHQLRAAGYVLRRKNGTVLLKTWPKEQALMPLAVLGYTVEDLTLRFGMPFPKDVPAGSARQDAPPAPRHAA